jgi:hypothetical protein
MNDQKLTDCLIYMIKRSPSLIHLNLSCIGLYENLLIQFGKALRRSRSL